MHLDKLTSVAQPDSSMAVKPKDDPKKIADAAKQFEALFIGQMMKSMSEAEGGWMGTGDDQSASSAMQYAQETFAQSLSAKGGLGLASMVVKGLEQQK
jgi:Rod binding domain-containing protein